MMYAPVLVTVYDRPNHFKACIESLVQNKGAERTSLFISSDGPRDAISAEKVRSVRDYIKTIKGFKEVCVFSPEENTSGKIKLITYEKIKRDFPRYILTEDDNVFSPYALNYFNQGLDIFEDDPDVSAVCGYMYPGFPSNGFEQIYLHCWAGWGVALWRNKDIYPGFDEKLLAREVLSNRILFNKLNNSLPHVPPMIKSIIEGKLEAGDVTWCNYIIKNNQVAVFPSVSLVRNLGNDGTGEHCGINKVYENQKILGQEIKFNMVKPRRPVVDDEKWIANFFGGKKAIFRNKLVFAEFNAANRFSKSLVAAFILIIWIFCFSARLYRLARKSFA